MNITEVKIVPQPAMPVWAGETVQEVIQDFGRWLEMSIPSILELHEFFSGSVVPKRINASHWLSMCEGQTWRKKDERYIFLTSCDLYTDQEEVVYGLTWPHVGSVLSTYRLYEANLGRQELVPDLFWTVAEQEVAKLLFGLRAGKHSDGCIMNDIASTSVLYGLTNYRLTMVGTVYCTQCRNQLRLHQMTA